MEKNKVLVILASFNGVKYIEEQINSILNQESVKLDLLVVDDASNDNTFEILERFLSNKNVFIQKRKIGSGSAAKNFLLAIQSLAESTIDNYHYIALADQDDIWLPSKINSAIELLNDDGSDLYCSNLTLWDENSNDYHVIKKNDPQRHYDYLFEGGSAGCTYVFTRKLCKEISREILKIDIDKWKYFSHDWFIYFLARQKNYSVSIDANSYILYRVHANNVHGQLNKKNFTAYLSRFKLVWNGWYFYQAKGFMDYLPVESKEFKIYKKYTSSYFSRVSLLIMQNFQLIRNRRKAIKFMLISCIPVFKGKKR